MNPKVLITGSGNITGLNVVRGLAKSNYQVVGCDINKDNPANEFCKNYTVPHCTDAGYISAIIDILRKEEIVAVIPSNDHEVRALSENILLLKEMGVALNAYTDRILSYLDKFQTARLFTAHDILTPEIVDLESDDYPYVIRKNIVGEGQKFVHIVNNDEDRRALGSLDPANAIATKFVSGEEYTIDVLLDEDSNVLSCVPRLRRIVKNGMVHFGEIVHDEEVITRSIELSHKLKLRGMNCIQCIKRDGRCYFFEINPRPGSGIDMTIRAGANFPVLWLDVLAGKGIENLKIDWGLKMLRITDGYFFK